MKKNITRSFSLCLMVACCTLVLHAQEFSKIPAAFVDIGFGARPVALGNAFVGLANDANSVVWNPAGLINIQKNQATFSYCKQLSLIPYAYFAVVLPLAKSEHSIGLGLISSGDEALRELTAQVSYAYALTPLVSIGGTVKYRHASFGNNSINPQDFPIWEADEIDDALRNQIRGSAEGIGFDLGMLYKPTKDVSLGITIKDVHAPVSWNSTNSNTISQPKGRSTEMIPYELTVGSALYIFDDVIMTTDFSPSTASELSNKFKFGIEATFLELIALRGGSCQYLNSLIEDDNYMLGIGIDVQQLKDVRILMDYTFLFTTIANTSRISLSVEF